MLDTRFRLITIGVSLVVAGPLAGSVVGGLRLPDGGSGATAMTSQTPAIGVGVLLAALSIMGLVGMGAARLFGARHGMLCAGLVMAWIAWRQGTTERILIHTRESTMLVMLSLEGLVVGMLGVVVVAGMLAADRGLVGGKRSDLAASVLPGSVGAVWIENLLSLIRGLGFGEGGAGQGKWYLAAMAGIVFGAAAVMVVGVEALKGQMVFAAIGAGVLAGASCRAIERNRELGVASVLAPFVALGVLGVAGPLVAWWFQRGDVVEMAFAGRLFRVANPVASDWLAGGLLGVPLGVSWASSLMPRHEEVVEGT